MSDNSSSGSEAICFAARQFILQINKEKLLAIATQRCEGKVKQESLKRQTDQIIQLMDALVCGIKSISDSGPKNLLLFLHDTFNGPMIPYSKANSDLLQKALREREKEKKARFADPDSLSWFVDDKYS